MLSWLATNGQRKAIRQDRKYIVGRARRFLLSYLAAGEAQKQQYYELVAGAAAACQPAVSDPNVKNTETCQTIAETARRVVKMRERQASDKDGHLAALITDAYATVAMAYRRAAAVYVLDEEMQQIGTAAVHMVTIANSFMAAQSEATTQASVQ
jgi:hypothetical protein